MGLLDGKTAVITGSTRGFGLAVARAYAREGASVVISSRTAAAVEQTVADFKSIGSQVSGIACDIAELAQVQALAEHAIHTFGSLDIWVNNAAISAPYGATIDIEPEYFTRVLNVNILGTYYGSLVAMRHFLKNGSGKLINILGVGDKRPTPMQVAYASSKAWLIQFTRAMAKEYKDSGVGVYTLNPGMMDTDLLQKVEVIQGYEHRLDRFENVVKVLSQSPDVPAQKALWLASDDTNGRTGLVVRELTKGKTIRNALRNAFNLLSGKPGREVDVQIISVPSAFRASKR